MSMTFRSVVGRDHKDDAVAHAFVSLTPALGGWSGGVTVGGGAAAR